MRAYEFIPEKINPDTIEPGFEITRRMKNGLVIRARGEHPVNSPTDLKTRSLGFHMQIRRPMPVSGGDEVVHQTDRRSVEVIGADFGLGHQVSLWAGMTLWRSGDENLDDLPGEKVVRSAYHPRGPRYGRMPSSGTRPSRPAWKSSNACCSSVRVFITNGPWAAMGSWSG